MHLLFPIHFPIKVDLPWFTNGKNMEIRLKEGVHFGSSPERASRWLNPAQRIPSSNESITIFDRCIIYRWFPLKWQSARISDIFKRQKRRYHGVLQWHFDHLEYVGSKTESNYHFVGLWYHYHCKIKSQALAGVSCPICPVETCWNNIPFCTAELQWKSRVGRPGHSCLCSEKGQKGSDEQSPYLRRYRHWQVMISYKVMKQSGGWSVVISAIIESRVL